MGLMQDKEGYERKLKGCEQELERQKGYTNEFAFKIIVLSCEIQRLSQEGGMSSKAKAKEMMEMQESYSTIQRKVNAKNQEIEMLITKITSLENAYIYLKKQSWQYEQRIRKNPEISLKILIRNKKVSEVNRVIPKLRQKDNNSRQRNRPSNKLKP